MDGRIDEVAVYETVLSASRIGIHFGFADSALIGRGAALAGGKAPLEVSPSGTHPPTGGDVDVVITGGEIGAGPETDEGLFPPFFVSVDSFPASNVPATDLPLDGEINVVVTAGVHDTVLTGGSHDTVLTGGTVNEVVTGGDVNEVVTGGEIVEEAVVEDGEEAPRRAAPPVLPGRRGLSGDTSGRGAACTCPSIRRPRLIRRASERNGGGLHLPFYPASETYPGGSVRPRKSRGSRRRRPASTSAATWRRSSTAGPTTRRSPAARRGGADRRRG